MIDWINFFDTRRIHYVDSGPNVARGNIACSCPWCGIDDPSEHLSINLDGKGFRCWRNKQHAGKNPVKLVQALLKCSWEQAEQIVGQKKSLPDDFMNKVKSSILKSDIPKQLIYPKIPIEFKTFVDRPSCKYHIGYLRRRGFTDHNIFRDTIDYDIYYATRGLYAGRIIFTVWFEGKLCGWTGRTIYDQEQVRYSTLTNNAETAFERGETPAPFPISHYLLFYDRIANANADTIVLCEGPFDAWRVNLLGKDLGVVATCFFTSMLSDQQLNLLHEVLPRYKNKILLLDQNTFSKAARIKSDLVTLGVETKRLPISIKDPGEISDQKTLQEVLAIY